MAISTADRIEALRAIPLFSYLTPEELLAAQVLFEEMSCPKGEVICRIGDEGDTFYIVLSGELEVWGGGSPSKLLSRLGPKDFFGELALVVGGPRSATITVSRQARLLSLSKDSFNRFFLKNAKVLEYFSRVICQRLAATASSQTVESRSSKVIGVIAEPYLQGSSLVAASVACLLDQWTDQDVLWVEVGKGIDRTRGKSGGKGVGQGAIRLSQQPDRILSRVRRTPGLPAKLEIELSDREEMVSQGDRLSSLVTALCQRFDFVVLDLGSEPESMIRTVGAYADVAIRVVDSPSGEGADPRGLRTFEVLNLYNRGTRRVPNNSCEPFVLPKDPNLPAELSALALGEKIARAPRSVAGLPLHRLVRKILGRTLGIALGGGAAFGLAHLGVLKVFEQHGLPVDLLAGCSMGSMVAIGYAAGLSVAQLESMADDLGTKSKLLNLVRRDSTLTQPGFLSGDTIVETISPFLEDRQTFRHLRIPCRAVATDIETGERVSIGTGRLDEAFRASSSVPIVMAPVRRGNRILVDGAVCDPVPAEVLREMGADIIVAINVVPPMKKGVEGLPSRIYRRLNLFNPLAYLGQSLDLPNLFDIAMSSMQTLQHELGNFKAISADVRINPDLSDFTWIEFYRNRELIAKGYESAELAVPAIKKALARADV